MKSYKITSEKECHHGLQYKDGLVVDHIPFNPSGDCETGGIYFAREDVLAFLDYGPWIREVTLPDGEEEYANPGSPRKYKAHRVILGPRRRIDVEVIKELIEEGADPKANYSEALRWAAKNNHIEIVKLLIPVSDPKSKYWDGNSEALRLAAERGHSKVVKLLVPVSDPKARNSEALRLAAAKGHSKVVELLIPVSDPKDGNSEALRLAAERGHSKVVELLSPVSDKSKI